MISSDVYAKLEEANKLIFVKKYAEAESMILGLLHDSHLANPLLHLRLIELSVKLGKISGLIAYFRHLAESNPKESSLKITIVLAEQHGELIDSQEAMVRFGDLLKIHGGSAILYYGMGFSMEVSGNLDRALFNYEQCINCDPEFYPGFFGLSQVHYQKGDDAKGDYYFKLFEDSAPYNVYGNFETHRHLSNEYLERNRFLESEIAIKTLSEWWMDNKGGCPPEIQIYEGYSVGRILDRRGEKAAAKARIAQTEAIVGHMLEDANTPIGVMYFIAKTLEEFANFELALRFYKKILSMESIDSEMVQRIGGQFLSMGEFELSRQLFESAYQNQPDNHEINFCLLISKLRLADVNVEEYLLTKERMKQLIGSSSDRVELLSLLHNLLAKFTDDPEVHANLGDIYLRLGNIERARKHFEKMHALDPLSNQSGLRYAGFELQFGDPQKSMKILTAIENQKGLSPQQANEIHWLRASNYLKVGNFGESRRALRLPLLSDPWNVSYVVFDLVNMIKLAMLQDSTLEVDSLLDKLMTGNEENLNWDAFDKTTNQWEQRHQFEIVYGREKLRFLYLNNRSKVLLRLVRAACRFDAGKATYDFLKLLNTNFDGPEIYWALGMLFKENWQLETATVWFEQLINLPGDKSGYDAKAFLELADCYVWRDQQLDKAIEYVKIALNMGYKENGSSAASTVLAHAYLRQGQVKQAEAYLQDQELEKNLEAIYLKGLLLYRNGQQHKANLIWKPLLTVRSESLRSHHIKQEVLKYYFEKEPYFQAN